MVRTYRSFENPLSQEHRKLLGWTGAPEAKTDDILSFEEFHQWKFK
jgi:hypothetical protein